MPRKIKLLWVLSIVLIIFGFVYFAFTGKVEEGMQNAKDRTKQDHRIKEKLEAKRVENKGRTFRVDPIKEIKELNALGKHEEAVKYAEGMATLNPDQPKIYTWWGISLVKSGRNNEAIKKFVKSTKLDVSYAKAYLYWGLTLAMQGKSEEAIKKYIRVIELDPDNSNAYAYWGASLNALEKYGDALNKLDESLSLHLLNSTAHTLRIDVLYNLNRYDEAWRAVHKAQAANILVPKGSLDRLAKALPEPKKIP